MGKLCLVAATVIAVLVGLAGCASTGNGHGPIETFVIPAAVNPGLPGDSVGTLNLRAAPHEISLVVPPGTNVHALVAKFSLNVEATITVISSGSRIVQQNGVTPNDFSVPVMYSIETSDQKEPWRYRVTVRVMETNSHLARLVLPAGSRLQPAFDPAVHEYRAEVPFASAMVRVEAMTQSRFVKSVSVDGKETPGPVGRADVDFSSIQEKPVTIDTLAEDGATRERYLITLVRGSPDGNAFLGSLEIQGVPFSPAFSPAQLGYQVTVPYGTQSLVIRAQPQSPFATVALAAGAVISGGRSVAVPFAANGDLSGSAGAVVDFSQSAVLPLLVSVTAQNGGIQQYIIDIQRGPPDSNNLLADLSLDIGGINAPLSPDFGPNQLRYAAVVPFSANQVRVMAHAQSGVATLQLDGGQMGLPVRGNPGSGEGALVDLPSGMDRFPLRLLVTAQNGGALRYLVEVRRGLPPAPAQPQVQQAPSPALQAAPQPQPAQPQQPPTATTMQVNPPAQRPSPAPAAAPPAAPAGTLPATNRPAGTGSDHVLVSAKDLVLGSNEVSALVAAKDMVGKTARITVRPYRSSEILGQDSTAVETLQKEGKLSLSLRYRSPGVTLGKDGFIEIEVVIPTAAGRYLYYKEAMPAAEEVGLTVPFFLYEASVPVAWPAIGSPAQVAGYVPLGGHQRPEDREGFQKNAKGEYGVDIEIVDLKSGRSYGKDTTWRKPGIAPGQAFAFTAPIGVPEGAVVGYTMTARTANGRAWSATGQAQVWTTRLRYKGGFEPVLLPLSDELAPAAGEMGEQPGGKH